MARGGQSDGPGTPSGLVDVGGLGRDAPPDRLLVGERGGAPSGPQRRVRACPRLPHLRSPLEAGMGSGGAGVAPMKEADDGEAVVQAPQADAQEPVRAAGAKGVPDAGQEPRPQRQGAGEPDVPAGEAVEVVEGEDRRQGEPGAGQGTEAELDPDPSRRRPRLHRLSGDPDALRTGLRHLRAARGRRTDAAARVGHPRRARRRRGLRHHPPARNVGGAGDDLCLLGVRRRGAGHRVRRRRLPRRLVQPDRHVLRARCGRGRRRPADARPAVAVVPAQRLRHQGDAPAPQRDGRLHLGIRRRRRQRHRQDRHRRRRSPRHQRALAAVRVPARSATS